MCHLYTANLVCDAAGRFSHHVSLFPCFIPFPSAFLCCSSIQFFGGRWGVMSSTFQNSVLSHNRSVTPAKWKCILWNSRNLIKLLFFALSHTQFFLHPPAFLMFSAWISLFCFQLEKQFSPTGNRNVWFLYMTLLLNIAIWLSIPLSRINCKVLLSMPCSW